MSWLILLLVLIIPAVALSCVGEETKPLEEVSFETADGGRIFAHLYGKGDHGVVLAHGAVFNKESWDPFAQHLSARGFRAMAIDFRGYGQSIAGTRSQALFLDILAAVDYFRKEGVKKISLIGGSMGGGAAAQAAVESKPGDIDRLILLSPIPIKNPEGMKAGQILFIASQGEKIMPKIKGQFERAPAPKELSLQEGNAHGQHMFKEDHSQALTERITTFLSDAKD